MLDVDAAVRAAYFDLLEGPDAARAAATARSLSESYADAELLDMDSVGRLASVINYYFDATEDPSFYDIFDVFVDGFEAFLRAKNVVDEQQWRAFYRIVRDFYREADVHVDVFTLVRDAMYASTPPFWHTPETRAQVLTLQLLFGADVACLPARRT